MAIEVGMVLGIDPEEIYTKWQPGKLASMYTYIVNRSYRKNYLALSDKEQLKHPEVIIERILSEKEIELYKKQKKQFRSKIETFDKLNKNYG